jgi:hypothetical protein
MKLEVQQELERVLGYPFFECVGQALPSTVTPVTTWAAAMKHRNSQKWENCRLMARNALDGLVEQKSWERSQEWNPLVTEIRPTINAFVERVLPKWSVPKDFHSKLKDGLCWDILAMCLEQHYRDLIEPPFYIAYLQPWYASGHFPCGWDGPEFPAGWDGVVRRGRLIVF